MLSCVLSRIISSEKNQFSTPHQPQWDGGLVVNDADDDDDDDEGRPV